MNVTGDGCGVASRRDGDRRSVSVVPEDDPAFFGDAFNGIYFDPKAFSPVRFAEKAQAVGVNEVTAPVLVAWWRDRRPFGAERLSNGLTQFLYGGGHVSRAP